MKTSLNIDPKAVLVCIYEDVETITFQGAIFGFLRFFVWMCLCVSLFIYFFVKAILHKTVNIYDIKITKTIMFNDSP